MQEATPSPSACPPESECSVTRAGPFRSPGDWLPLHWQHDRARYGDFRRIPSAHGASHRPSTRLVTGREPAGPSWDAPAPAGAGARGTPTWRRSTAPSSQGSRCVRRGRRHSRDHAARVLTVRGTSPRRRHRRRRRRSPRRGTPGSTRPGSRGEAWHRVMTRHGPGETAHGSPIGVPDRGFGGSSDSPDVESGGGAWRDVGALVRARADAVDDPTRWFDPPGVLP